jgi:hypothetical protein
MIPFPVFEVQGEYVALRDRVTMNGAADAGGGADQRPSTTSDVTSRCTSSLNGGTPFSPQLGRGRGRLNPNDTRALTFLLRLLQKRPRH